MAIVLLGAAAGCSDPKRDIVGTWAEEGGSRQLQFKADGTVTIGSIALKGVSTTTEFTWPDESHIQFQLSAGGLSVGGKKRAVSISGDRLTLTGEDGKGETFKRVH